MPLLRPPRFEGIFRLPDGRRLGYAEFGPPDGRPLVWFHGTPGARRQVAPAMREAGYERDVRVVAVERPGIGDSTPHAYDSITQWAHDIEKLCDGIGIERFGVAGLSGGGPYALACAHELPHRVVAAAVLGGVAPSVGPDAAPGGVSNLVRMSWPVTTYANSLLDLFMRGLVLVLEPVKDRAVDVVASLMPPGDQRIFADPAIRFMFTDDLLRAGRRQMRAMFYDARLFGQDWGFRLGDVRVPIHLWYGDADNIVPLKHGRHMAERIPGAVLRVRPEEGHLGGLGATHEIIDAFLSHWQRPPRRAKRS